MLLKNLRDQSFHLSIQIFTEKITMARFFVPPQFLYNIHTNYSIYTNGTVPISFLDPQ